MNTKLKLALLAHPQPQYEVARRLGVSETRLSRIVQGRIDPSVTERNGLAAVLGVGVDDLFDSDSDTATAASHQGVGLKRAE